MSKNLWVKRKTEEAKNNNNTSTGLKAQNKNMSTFSGSKEIEKAEIMNEDFVIFRLRRKVGIDPIDILSNSV
jgi:hypothetical protein